MFKGLPASSRTKKHSAFYASICVGTRSSINDKLDVLTFDLNRMMIIHVARIRIHDRRARFGSLRYGRLLARSAIILVVVRDFSHAAATAALVPLCA